MMDDLKTDLDLEDEKVTGIDCLKAENSLLRHQLEYHQKYIIPDKYIQYSNSLKKQLEEQKTFYENELNQKTKAHTQAFQIEMINQSRLERYWEIESEHLKKVIEEKDLKIKQDSEQMKKTIEEKDFQLKQSGQLIDKLKQRINDSQNEMDKLEDDYNKANIVIETLENQRISLVENHNYIMSNPILAELIGAHLRSKSINQQITYSSNNDSIINKNNADTLSIKRESLEVASPFLPYRRSGLTKNRKRKKRRSKLYETKKEMREVEEKLFRVREECAHYTEHDTQDGKKYYFNAKLNQSVWDKPKCLSELTGFESKLEEDQINRSNKKISGCIYNLMDLKVERSSSLNGF